MPDHPLDGPVGLSVKAFEQAKSYLASALGSGSLFKDTS